MRTNLSNTTPEAAAEKKAEVEKQRKCSQCGADREQAMRMHHFHNGIIDYLRECRVVKRDSCIQCVQKHIGKAMVLYKELLTATETNNVNIELNHLEVIGNLQAAADEAEEWQELRDAIDVAEREYRYKGVGPDWEHLATRIDEVAKQSQADGTGSNQEG